MAEDFETFWKAYPKRPACRDKMTARLLWDGERRLNDGSFIDPSMHEQIIEGARAYAEIAASNEFRWNECRWLRAGAWEGSIEELAERRAEEAVRTDGRAYRDAYHAWKAREHDAGRLGTREEFELQVARGRPVLRVVG